MDPQTNLLSGRGHMQASELHTDAEAHHSPDPSPVPDLEPTEPVHDPPGDEDRPLLTRNEIFGILSNPRRRAAIRYLNEKEDDLVQLRDVAEQLAAWENDVPVDSVTYKQRKRVYTSLYQSHLPKMDDMGIVRFDKHRGTIEATVWTRELENYLHALGDGGVERRYATVGAAALCLGLIAALWLGPLSIATGTTVGLALGVVATVVATSVIRKLRSR